MCARKYGMRARKYGPLGHQTDNIRNDIILSYEVAGLHITAPISFTSNELTMKNEALFQHKQGNINEKALIMYSSTKY
jgi:hypothetical protein